MKAKGRFFQKVWYSFLIKKCAKNYPEKEIFELCSVYSQFDCSVRGRENSKYKA